jgi:hypothetical protein
VYVEVYAGSAEPDEEFGLDPYLSLGPKGLFLLREAGCVCMGFSEVHQAKGRIETLPDTVALG